MNVGPRGALGASTRRPQGQYARISGPVPWPCRRAARWHRGGEHGRGRPVADAGLAVGTFGHVDTERRLDASRNGSGKPPNVVVVSEHHEYCIPGDRDAARGGTGAGACIPSDDPPALLCVPVGLLHVQGYDPPRKLACFVRRSVPRDATAHTAHRDGMVGCNAVHGHRMESGWPGPKAPTGRHFWITSSLLSALIGGVGIVAPTALSEYPFVW